MRTQVKPRWGLATEIGMRWCAKCARDNHPKARLDPPAPPLASYFLYKQTPLRPKQLAVSAGSGANGAWEG